MLDTVMTVTSAATVASLLTALAKMAWPRAESWYIVIVSLLSGMAAACLLTAAVQEVWTIQLVAQTIIQGIVAAATAAGVSRTDNAAEVQRRAAQMRGDV